MNERCANFIPDSCVEAKVPTICRGFKENCLFPELYRPLTRPESLTAILPDNTLDPDYVDNKVEVLDRTIFFLQRQLGELMEERKIWVGTQKAQRRNGNH